MFSSSTIDGGGAFVPGDDYGAAQEGAEDAWPKEAEEEDFQETLSLVREGQFDQAYVFKYSERRDTPAATMPNQAPQEVREERNDRLLNQVNEVAAEKYQRLVGKRVEILVEGPSKRNPARSTGRTRCNKIVVFDGSNRHHGEILNVDVTGTGAFTLYANPDILE